MNNLFFRPLLFISLLTLVACGGGSGSDPFSGVWSGRLQLVETNPEGCEDDLFLDREYEVSIEDTIVFSEIDSGFPYETIQTSENSFEATTSQVASFGSFFVRVTFEEVGDGMANVTVFFDSSSRSSSCSRRWSGVMQR